MLSVLRVFSEATEPMMPVEVGESIGMTVLNTGPLLSRILVRGLVEKPDKKKNRYQITPRGEEFLANPPEPKTNPVTPAVPSAAPPPAPPAAPPAAPPPTPPPEDSVIPSQADIFRSMAEQLGITKAMDTAEGGTSLDGIMNYVQRTADLDDLNSLWNAAQVY